MLFLLDILLCTATETSLLSVYLSAVFILCISKHEAVVYCIKILSVPLLLKCCPGRLCELCSDK